MNRFALNQFVDDADEVSILNNLIFLIDTLYIIIHLSYRLTEKKISITIKKFFFPMTSWMHIFLFAQVHLSEDELYSHVDDLQLMFRDY